MPLTEVNCKQLKLQFISSNTEELMEGGDDFVAYVTKVNGRLSTIEHRVKAPEKTKRWRSPWLNLKLVKIA